MRRNRWSIVLLSVAGALALPGTAGATSISVDDTGHLRIAGDDGPNTVTISDQAGTSSWRVLVRDTTTPTVTVGAGCTPAGTNDGATCDVPYQPGGYILIATLGAGDDRFSGESLFGLDVNGGAGDDILDGSPYNDVIDGGPGKDTFNALDGTDRVISRDGVAEAADCGAGVSDTIVADATDRPTSCEVVELADDDGDGYKTDTDCNDQDASVHPNAPEIAENGRDDDCRDGDAVNMDRDGDGMPRPFDCDDANPAIRPGIREVPGNAVDENCDGVAARLETVTAFLNSFYRTLAGFTQITRFVVSDLSPATSVQLRCRGRGCPFKRKRFAPSPRHSRDLGGLLRRRRFRPGAVLEVWLTEPERIGKVVRVVFRAGLPARRVLCLPPGATKPGRC